MARRPTTTLACGGLLLLCVRVTDGIAANNPYLTEDDYAALSLARESVDAFCIVRPVTDAEASEGRALLTRNLGGDNFVLEAAENADSVSDFRSKLQVMVNPRWVLGRMAALLSGACVLLCCLLACCTTWPCCKCLRCCRMERKDTCKYKTAIAVLMVGSLVGILAATATTYKGTGKAVQGLDNMGCASAKAIDGTLGGISQPYFVGLVPAVEAIWHLDQQLDDGSPLLQAINGLMDSTGPIEQSVTIAADILNLLADMLGRNETVHPRNSAGKDLLHDCKPCASVSGPLGDVADILRSSVGAKMNEVRAMVEKKLSVAERSKLQMHLRNTTKPLVEVKQLARERLRFFIEPDGLLEYRSKLEKYVPVALNVVGVPALLFFFFGALSIACWVFRESRMNVEGKHTYTRTPHRLACFTMCTAVPLFVVPVIVLSGLLDSATTVLSAACLTLDSINGQTYRNIAWAFDAPTKYMDTTVQFLDSCIAGEGGPNPNLLDMINVTNATDNSTVTMREKVMHMAVTPLKFVFDALDKATAEAKNVSIADNPTVVKLVALLNGRPVDAMMVANWSTIQDDMTLQPIVYEPSLHVGLWTTARCGNFSQVRIQNEGSNTTLPGVDNFVQELRKFATGVIPYRNGAGNCTPQVSCRTGMPLKTMKACAAANRYMLLKREVIESRIYRCDLFMKADGSECDPLDMKKVDGTWVGDCLINDGGKWVTRRKARSCNLLEFTEYVQKFSDRVEISMDRLADTTVYLTEDLTFRLRDIVDKYILNPLNGILDGVTCGFMPPLYQQMVWGMCYQGVVGARQVGISYAALGGVVLAMAIVLYLAWRVEVDNVNAQKRRFKSSCSEV